MNKDVFRNISYGVYIITAMDGERPTGCTANSIMQVTSEPATMAVSINHENYTNGCIKKFGKFAFSIMAEDSDAKLIGNFGFRSGKDTNKFQEADYKMAEGVPVIKNTCGYVVCKVIDQMETSTHTIFLGEVIAAERFETKAQAMTYAYYHQVIKGKSPKNAPTYLPENQTEKKVEHVCDVCGYVYQGDPLPVDFICPVCGVGADRFYKTEL